MAPVREDDVSSSPIAVFDSGLGGLSVIRQLNRLLPNEDIVYFGDTARVPYGIKSRRTVAHFAVEDARFLLRFEPKLIVVACNTVSALAMDALQRELPVPVLGVVKPGARAAAKSANGKPIAVIGTEATIASNAYVEAIRSADADLKVISQACPLFVPLVEEGRDCDDPIVKLTVETYLSPLREAGVGVVVLGCTHYPLLHDAIVAVLGKGVKVIQSGLETARSVRSALRRAGSLCEVPRVASIRYFVSDNPSRFRRIGSRFLDTEIDEVELVEPEQYIAGAVLDGRAR